MTVAIKNLCPINVLTKLRKMTFFIAAFIFISITLSNRAAISQAGISISLDKEIYYVGDTIRVSYSSIPGDKDEDGNDTGVRYNIEVRWSTGGLADSYWFSGRGRKSGVRVMGYLIGSDLGKPTARDLTVTLTREDKRSTPYTVTTLITKHIRLRQRKYEPIPGALSLRGGSRFKLGDPIIVDVNLPPSIKIPDPVFTDEDIFGEDIYVGLVYLNRKTHGGAIQPDQGIYMKSYNRHYSRINSHADEIIVNQTERLLSPGIYELRLFRGRGHVLDSVRFEIVIEPWPKSLKVASLDDFKVGEDIKVQLDRAALPFKDYASSPFKDRLVVSLFKVVNNIEEIHIPPTKNPYPATIIDDDVYLQFIWQSANRDFSTDYDLGFKIVKAQAGKYMFLLSYGPDGPNNVMYVLDHLKIDVPDKKELSRHIGTGKKFRFIPGEKIPIEVYMPSTPSPGFTTVVSLEGGGEHKEWDVEVGKKKAWTIPGDLAMGSYLLTLDTTFIYDGKKQREEQPASVWFEVVPAVNTVKIDIKNKKEFLYGETITFDVMFPKSMNSKKKELVYTIVEKGGFVPGCARKGDSFVMGRTPIKNGLKNISFVTPPPGRYVLQLIGSLLNDQSSPVYHYSNYDFSPVWSSYILAEASFTVDLQWQPGGLSFSSQKAEFPYGEEIHVVIDAHADLGMSKRVNEVNENGKYMLYLYGQGDVGYGGAYRYPWGTNHYDATFVVQEVAPKDNFVLKKEQSTSWKQPAWLLPGAYEFRLYNNQRDRDAFLVSRLPFYVTEPQSPFPIEKGKPGVPQPSDLESPGLFHGLMIGELFGADPCQVISVEITEPEPPYASLDLIEVGDSFRVKVVFKKDPKVDSKPVSVQSTPTNAEIQVFAKRTDDPLVFLTDPIFVVPPDELRAEPRVEP